ncbi:MAG: hypothetical protein LAP40_12045 [Acidobacteriia bacterium]|nr:hypothetical protein [Terriglobia bacterium]
MKLGLQDRNKVIILAALVGVGVYLKVSDVLSSPGSGSSAPAAAAAEAPPRIVAESAPPPARTAQRSRIQSDEFHPVLHSKRPEDRIDPAKVDPTLRLDLLAKLERVDASAPGRNLFQFGPPPAPAVVKGPEPKVIPQPLPVAAASGPAQPLAPPPPPRIPLRYYGFTSVSGATAKTAFFLDGDEILVAKEGETLKRRYRVVSIGLNSVVMEDTESKHQQTIPMEPANG